MAIISGKPAQTCRLTAEFSISPAIELVFIAAFAGFGLLVSFVAARDAIISELSDAAGMVQDVNQSYSMRTTLPRPKKFTPLSMSEHSSQIVEVALPGFEGDETKPPAPPEYTMDSRSTIPVNGLPVDEESHYSQPLRVSTPADLWKGDAPNFSNGQVGIQSTDDR